MNSCFGQSLAVRFMVIAAACVVLIAGMRAISAVLNPILLAVLFAVALDIPRAWLRRRGLTPGLVSAVTISGALILTLLLTSLVGTTLQNLSAALPTYQHQLQVQIGILAEMLAGYGIEIDKPRMLTLDEDTNPLGIVRYALAGVAGIVSSAFLILLYTVFLLMETGTFGKKLNQAFKASDTARLYSETVTVNLRRFLAAQVLVSLITGMSVTGALWMLGVEFAVLWGFVAFLMNFIPYIGSIVAAIPAVVATFVQYGPALDVVWVLAAYAVVNLVVSYVIYPRLMSHGVGLSMFVVLAAMVFWGWVLGPVGLILAVPITAVLKISLEAYPGSRWLGVMLGNGSDDRSRTDSVPFAG